MIKGVILLLMSAFMFSCSTVFLKIATSAPYHVAPQLATFVRFFVGLIMFSYIPLIKKEHLKINNFGAVSMRAIMNTLAVILFFAAVKYTTVTKSNILNLTYPAFVFLFAPFITGEKQSVHHYFFLALTLLGSAFIVMGGDSHVSFSSVNVGDVLALLSGIVAGIAISGLREARKYDSAHTILFYTMSFGSIVTFFWMLPSFVMPGKTAMFLMLAAALLSNIGQFFITEGYLYISASVGSIILESGIVFAAVLGISIFHDPITPFIAFGGLLIFLSIGGISGMLLHQSVDK